MFISASLAESFWALLITSRKMDQVTEALVRMTVQAPSSIVRAKSTLALSMFLSEIQVSSNSDCCLQVIT